MSHAQTTKIRVRRFWPEEFPDAWVARNTETGKLVALGPLAFVLNLVIRAGWEVHWNFHTTPVTRRTR